MLFNDKNILTSSAYIKVFEFLITNGRSFKKEQIVEAQDDYTVLQLTAHQ